ncbi:MAG TPA: hypothetical protein VGH80_02085 [Xanthomonadaceae bacterium]
MFLRFVAADRDQRTGQPTGLLTIAYELLRSDDLIAAEADELRGHLTWLEVHVPVPTRFARKRNVSHKETHGLSWVKTCATEVVGRLYALSEIARRHGHSIDILQTARPCYVVYEDKWQIVAEPFHGEQR